MVDELRRLSNISEYHVQWKPSTFEWGFSIIGLRRIGRPAEAKFQGTATGPKDSPQFGANRKIVEGNQRGSEPSHSLSALIQPLIRALAPEDPTFC